MIVRLFFGKNITHKLASLFILLATMLIITSCGEKISEQPKPKITAQEVIANIKEDIALYKTVLDYQVGDIKVDLDSRTITYVNVEINYPETASPLGIPLTITTPEIQVVGVDMDTFTNHRGDISTYELLKVKNIKILAYNEIVMSAENSEIHNPAIPEKALLETLANNTTSLENKQKAFYSALSQLTAKQVVVDKASFSSSYNKVVMTIESAVIDQLDKYAYGPALFKNIAVTDLNAEKGPFTIGSMGWESISINPEYADFLLEKSNRPEALLWELLEIDMNDLHKFMSSINIKNFAITNIGFFNQDEFHGNIEQAKFNLLTDSDAVVTMDFGFHGVSIPVEAWDPAGKYSTIHNAPLVFNDRWIFKIKPADNENIGFDLSYSIEEDTLGTGEFTTSILAKGNAKLADPSSNILLNSFTTMIENKGFGDLLIQAESPNKPFAYNYTKFVDYNNKQIRDETIQPILMNYFEMMKNGGKVTIKSNLEKPMPIINVFESSEYKFIKNLMLTTTYTAPETPLARPYAQ